MEIKIKVKAGSKEDKIERKEGYYLVKVKAKAIEGKANLAVLRLLKKHFKKPARIIKGVKGREKVINLG